MKKSFLFIGFKSVNMDNVLYYELDPDPDAVHQTGYSITFYFIGGSKLAIALDTFQDKYDSIVLKLDIFDVYGDI